MPPQPARRFPRVQSERPTLIRLLGEEHSYEDLVRTRVIGLGGCMLVAPEPLGYSSLVELFISLGPAVVRTDGRVAYEIRKSDLEYEVGVEFLRLSAGDRSMLQALVAAGGRPPEVSFAARPN